MIIKLTQAEVRDIVGRALNLIPATFDIEISDCAPGAARRAIDILYALKTAVSEFAAYRTHDKIACIKRFRDLCPKEPDVNGVLYSCVGLADSKWAVENVSVAIRNLELTGSIKG